MIKYLGWLSVFALSASGRLRSDPEQDTSEKCLSCEAQVQQMYDTWTNETTVEEILEELQQGCKSYPYMQRQLCDKLAEIFVQIPPGLFEGMEDLAWPIPLAPCALVMQCSVNCCGADSPPEQVHLSLASNDHSIMGVTWTTLSQNASIVEYGSSADDLNNVESGSMDTYIASGWVGTIHRAKMINLSPASTYYYRVGDGSSWSETFSFSTLDPSRESLTFGIIGDMDFGEASDATVASIQALVDAGKIDVIVHSGDISYADGYEPHWDDFFNKVQPIASKIPYMATPGNHEFWFNFTSYKHRFYLPGTLDVGGSGDNMYFSWNAGYAHFLSCNSETPIDTANFNSQEVDWMKSDLKSVDRSVTPWVIANFHRPMYCQDNDETCERQANVLKSKAEDIFYENEVNAVITGHVHAYERTYPVYKETKMSDSYDGYTAPVHLMQGASGNREGNKGTYPPADSKEWSAGGSPEVGFALMTVSANSIDWTYYGSTLNGQDMPVLDHVTLTK